MARRKKKSWNASNPLYRWLHRKKKKVSRRAMPRKARRRASSMARRKHRVSHRAGFGGKGLMSGIYHPSGIVGQAIMGAGAATLVDKFVDVHPAQGVVAGFVVGGIGGAAGAYLRDMLKGGSGTGGTSSQSSVYR